MGSCAAPVLVNLSHVPARCKAMQLVLHLRRAWVPDCRCRSGVGALIPLANSGLVFPEQQDRLGTYLSLVLAHNL